MSHKITHEDLCIHILTQYYIFHKHLYSYMTHLMSHISLIYIFTLVILTHINSYHFVSNCVKLVEASKDLFEHILS